MNSSIAQILKICLGAVSSIISLVVSIIGNKIDADAKD